MTAAVRLGSNRAIVMQALARAARTVDAIADDTGMIPGEVRYAVADLKARGLVTGEGQPPRYALTPAGSEALRDLHDRYGLTRGAA